MPPAVSFLEPWPQRYQQGGHCRQHQEKDETGAGFAPTFPGVHASSLRTRCRNNSRKPIGEISRIAAPWLRRSAAKRSASLNYKAAEAAVGCRGDDIRRLRSRQAFAGSDHQTKFLPYLFQPRLKKQPPFFQDSDPVANLFHFSQMVARHKNRPPLADVIFN